MGQPAQRRPERRREEACRLEERERRADVWAHLGGCYWSFPLRGAGAKPELGASYILITGSVREYPHRSGPGLLSSGSGLGYKLPKKATTFSVFNAKLRPSQTPRHCGCSACAAAAGLRSGERREMQSLSPLHVPCAICRLSSLQTLNCARENPTQSVQGTSKD